jgi:putative ABC transport system permease protein
MTASPRPPLFRIGMWLLSRMLSRSKNYGLFGDISELYNERAFRKGHFRAGLWLWAQIIRSFPSYLLESLYWSGVMFRNYFKVTQRGLRRHKVYSLINFSGLAVGMACCILILAYVHWELGYDRYHAQADRIHRLAINGNISNRAFNIASTNNPVGPYLAEEWPEVEAAVRIRPRYRCAVSLQDKHFFEELIFWADSSLFDVFSFPLLKGNPETALKQPYSAVITETTAAKIFGQENPIGRILILEGQDEYAVTGVMADIPERSHFNADILLSFATRYLENRAQLERWMGDFNNFTYLLLTAGTDPAVLETRFPELIEQKMGKILQAVGANITYILQPLTKIHLHSKLMGEIGPVSDIAYIYLFSAVAAIILILACINFMNLATARSANRAREVGMRKVHGAVRSKLVRQFLGESMIFSFLSLGLAILLVESLLPLFRSLTGRPLDVPYFGIPWLIPGLLGLALAVGLLAGSYPAFYLARFQPTRVLKSQPVSGPRKSRFRQVLVAFQFAVSLFLIIGTAVILSQVNFMKHQPLGFDIERVISIQVTNDLVKEKLEPLKQEMLTVPGVLSAALSSHSLGTGARRNVCLPEGFMVEDAPMMAIIDAGPDFIPTVGIELAAGRTFSPEFPSDTEQSVLINETAALQFGWDEPIGKQIVELDDEERQKTVIGVVKDFHFISLHNPIEPMLISDEPGEFEILTVKLASGALPDVLGALENKWGSIAPGIPFDFTFLDQAFENQYGAEERLSRIFSYFSLLAIFIACLGLFGMAAYSAERRTKEIGIRKVLGASSSRLVLLLNREFALLVLLANLAAWPLVYWFAHNWLQDFAYRTPLHLGIFILAALGVFVIGLVTVSYQSLKASLTDPVDSLKYE